MNRTEYYAKHEILQLWADPDKLELYSPNEAMCQVRTKESKHVLATFFRVRGMGWTELQKGRSA
jgi:hypothetical protein